jgi:hypothetical protein
MWNLVRFSLGTSVSSASSDPTNNSTFISNVTVRRHTLSAPPASLNKHLMKIKKSGCGLSRHFRRRIEEYHEGPQSGELLSW